ncbi:MAG: arsenosugar biosynthesis radical SAM protein ArsS [Leptospiraceae bacterium]|nr:arsenosugar biosynthesis radical SAM protein ArsS [Leptospiraceae bacterium]
MQTPSFESILEKHSISLRAREIEIFQINMGKMCNLACKHCHVEAGPNRKEIMNRETLEKCLKLIDKHNFKTIDLTGGTPEVNPHFRWFISELGKRQKEVLVRSNLVVLLENEYSDMVELLTKNKITLIASFPHIQKDRTDKQRGNGVYDGLINIIRILNNLGYGINPELKLHLVHNPVGAYLPGNQIVLEQEYKKVLQNEYGIQFNSLYCITNMPIGRYLNFLKSSGNYESYMEELVNAFNPAAARNVMCVNTLSISYDGFLYDCDFNQMINLKLKNELPQHLDDFDLEKLAGREISIEDHCFGCTAGSGSSCGGAIQLEPAVANAPMG